jgi:hypothetical protein
MSDESSDGDYEVGYGRPPTHSRFKQGQSGNPSGKRKGGRSRVKELERFLDTPIHVNENGRRRQMRPMEIVRKKMFQLAAQGDVRAIKLMLDIEQLVDAHRVVERDKQVDFRKIGELFDKRASKRV